MSEIEDAVTIDRLTRERDALRTENHALHAQLNAQKEFLKDAIAPVYYRLAVAEVKALAAERDALKVQANEAVAKRNEAESRAEKAEGDAAEWHAELLRQTEREVVAARNECEALRVGHNEMVKALEKFTHPLSAVNLVNHLERQRAFSLRTFGPPEADPTSAHVRDHILKELKELEAQPDDLEEWIDVVLLGFDGAWRTGATSEQIAAALQAKQAKNESRTWPDWRTVAPGKAIEHVKCTFCVDAGCQWCGGY